MKKNAKRFAGMLLVLAMLLSLSVTAFAADYATVPVSDITVTVNVVNSKNPSDSYSKNVSVPAGGSVYDALVKGEQLGYWTVSGDFYGDSWFMNSMSCNGHPYATEPLLTQPDSVKDPETGVIYTTFEDWAKGYGLISQTEDGYTYCYVGYAWTYSVGGTTGGQDVGELAMNEFVLRNGNTITLKYDLQTTVWTQEDPLDPDPFAAP